MDEIEQATAAPGERRNVSSRCGMYTGKAGTVFERHPDGSIRFPVDAMQRCIRPDGHPGDHDFVDV